MENIAHHVTETLQLGPFYAATSSYSDGWDIHVVADDEDEEIRAWTLLYDVRRDMPELTREKLKNQPELWAADRDEAEMILSTLHKEWLRSEKRDG